MSRPAIGVSGANLPTNTIPTAYTDDERELLARIGYAYAEQLAESPREWFVAKKGLTDADLDTLERVLARTGHAPSWRKEG